MSELCRFAKETGSSTMTKSLVSSTNKLITAAFGRRSNIALDLQFMQIFTNQKYS